MMVKRILFQILVVYVVVYTVELTSFKEDYGWRDYEGVIPSDAVLVGKNEDGKNIHIGQVLYENKLIPGKILENDDNIYFEWYDQEESTNQNVKILCTENPDNLEWLYTRHNQIGYLTNKLLIKGGYEPNYFTYIGRTIRDGVSNVGKVICSLDDCLGLYTVSHGKTLLYQVYQILSYNPDGKKNGADKLIFTK